MKDKNGVDIQEGHLVKRYGMVKYADGLKPKVSKKTWVISRVENGKLFYTERFTDWKGEEVENEVELKRPKNEGEFIVVGDGRGFYSDFQSPETVKVNEGSVAGTYRILKDVEEQNWKAGEIVRIHGKVSHEMLERGVVEKVDDATPHKHVLVVVDTVKVLGAVNN